MARVRPLIALVLVLVHVMANGVLGPRVLCAERDGGTKFELASTRCCQDGEPADQDEHSPGGGERCDECVDTLIDYEKGVAQARVTLPEPELPAELPTAFFAAAFVALFALPTETAILTSYAVDSPGRSATIAHLATVILRV